MLNIFQELKCLLNMCPFQTAQDKTGCWGECVICGKRTGFVASEVLQRHLDRDLKVYQDLDDAIRSQLIHDLSQARRDREDAQAAYSNAQARGDTRAMNAAGRALKAATGRVMALELKENKT